jgi:hypothetical protein
MIQSVYAEISFSLGTYVLKRTQPRFSENIVSVCDVDIKKPLIGNTDRKQFLRCTANFDWATKDAKVSFTVHNVSSVVSRSDRI